MSLGSELGTGLGAFAQQFIGTQNTLKQQQLDQQQKDAEYNLKLRQQANTEAYNQSQLAQGQQTLDLQAARDAATIAKTGGDKRQTDFQNVLAPTYNGELQSLGDAIKNYGPSAGANFNPAVYDHAVTRMKQLKKLMGAVSLTTASGEGYDDARAALLNFVGAQDEAGNVHPAPSTTTPGGQTAPTPAAQPMPQIDMRFDPAARRDAMVNGDPAPQAAPTAPAALPASPAPVTSDLGSYPTIQDVPPSVLMNADNAALVARFGNGSDQYAQYARGAYRTALATQEKNILEGQAKFLMTAATKILDDPKHPATPKQLDAARIVSAYAGQPLLTPEQSQLLKQAIIDMAPNALNSVAWGDLLATKDPATILAAYPMYQKLAPEVVQGFNPTPYQTQAQSALDLEAAKTASEKAGAKKTDADGTRAAQITNLAGILGGAASLADVIKNGDTTTLRAIAANPESLALLGITDGGVNLTQQAQQIDDDIAAGTRQKTTQGDQNAAGARGSDAATAAAGVTSTNAAHDGAFKTIAASFATLDPRMSYDQIGKQMPGLVASVKSALGLNDVGLNNLIRQAQYQYGIGVRGDELKNKLTIAQTGQATAGAQRDTVAAGIATSEANRAAVLGGSKSVSDIIQAGDSATLRSLAADPAALRLLRITDGGRGLIAQANQIDRQKQATTASTTASANASNASATNSLATAKSTTAQLPGKVAETWANVGNLRSQIHDRNVRTNLDFQAQQGKLDLTQANIDHLTSQTLYQRAKNPNDPLYNPAIAAAKPGDPNAATYKQINALAGQARLAGDQVSKLQSQINALKPVPDGIGGIVGAPADDKAAAVWLAARNKQINDLTAKRDQAMKVANNRRALADKLLLDITPTGPATPTKPQKVGIGLPSAQGWAAQHVEVPGVDSDCAAIAGMYLNDLGYKIAPSNNAATLEKNALAAKWQPQGVAGVQPGDMVVWTSGNGKKYGLTSGKHVGVVADLVNGVPQILMNPGRLSDGSQGKTQIVPMFDPQNAKAYRAPSGTTKAPPTAAAPPAAAPVKVTAGTPLPTAPKPAAAPPKPAAFKPNPGLESGLITGVKNGDPDATNSFGNQMLKAGYSQDQVLAIIKRAQGQK